MTPEERFSPENLGRYCDILAEDMRILFAVIEAYEKNPNERTGWEVKSWWEAMMFSIKARVVEDVIREDFASDLKAYIGGLVDGKF